MSPGCDSCEEYRLAKHDAVNALQVLLFAVERQDWKAVRNAIELLYRIKDRP